MPLPRPSAPLPAGAHELRLVTEADLPALMAVNGDPAVTRFLPYAAWQTQADAQAWYDRMQAAVDTGGTLQFVFAASPGGAAIGTALLFRHDEGSGRIELGYVLGRAHWGRGVMQQVLPALLRYGFDAAGIRRVEAEVNPANTASMRVLQRLGFTQEGLLRQRWVGRDGQPYDIACFGLLAGELQAASGSGSATR